MVIDLGVAGGEIKQAGDRFIRSMIAICAADSLAAYKTRIGRAKTGVKTI
jgi:hypothetical protein